MPTAIEIRRLKPDGMSLLGEIDRSEHVDLLYAVDKGRLESRRVDRDVPAWQQEGSGEHSVAGIVETFGPVVMAGAHLLGAFDREEILGLAIVDGFFDPPLAWLALLHVSRGHRRLGVASALWAASRRIAIDAGADSMYVSATQTGSAVGFYLSRGCELADPPRPDLFAAEPDDIHLVCALD